MTVEIKPELESIRIYCNDNEEYEIIRDFVIAWGNYREFNGRLYSEDYYACIQQVRAAKGIQPLPSIASEGFPPRGHNYYNYFLTKTSSSVEEEIEDFSRNLTQEFPLLRVVIKD